MVHHHDPQCRAKRMGCYLQKQGCSAGSNPEKSNSFFSLHISWISELFATKLCIVAWVIFLSVLYGFPHSEKKFRLVFSFSITELCFPVLYMPIQKIATTQTEAKLLHPLSNQPFCCASSASDVTQSRFFSRPLPAFSNAIGNRYRVCLKGLSTELPQIWKVCIEFERE